MWIFDFISHGGQGTGTRKSVRSAFSAWPRDIALAAFAAVFCLGAASADTTVTLPIERRMLFNVWTNGVDYGDYFGGGWTHDTGWPLNSSLTTPFPMLRNRTFLLQGTNHTHTTGWKVTNGRLGTSSFLIGKKTFIAPQLYDGSVTNRQASLCNSLTASILSPYYTNGIGTIYFDIANITDPSDVEVQIATNMNHRTISGSVGPMLPEETASYVYNWVAVSNFSVNVSASTWITYQQTLDYLGPIRFRIIRTSLSTSYSMTTYGIDNAYIAVDNICVSYPRVGVRVSAGTIAKAPGLLAHANVTCKVSNTNFVSSLLPLMYSDHSTRTVTVYYKASTDTAYSSKTMDYQAGSGDGYGNSEGFQTEIDFPVGTATLDYYYACVVTGNRYFPTDYTLTGVNYWTSDGGGEPQKTAQSVTLHKDVSAWSEAKTTSTLDVNRVMLFNKWTNGVDYGDYFGGSWTHDGPNPNNSTGIFPANRARALLLPGSNHVHSAGWMVLEGKTGTSSHTPNGNYIAPYDFSGVGFTTNWQANLHNSLNAQILSPYYTNGIGTIYFDAVNVDDASAINVQIATNMVDAAIGPHAYVNVLYTNECVETDPMDPSITNHIYVYNWVDVSTNTLEYARASIRGTEGFLRYQKTFNLRIPARFRIIRSTLSSTTYSYPDYAFLAIDNIQVSRPPADVTIKQEDLAFDPGYPAVGQKLTVRCRVSNVGSNDTTTWGDRNVQVVYRWRYLDQSVGKWTTNTMTYVENAEGDDGAGNGELYLGDIPSQGLVGDVEYYFVCNFDGFRYVPVDYAQLGYTYWNATPDHSETLSPRTLRNTTDLGGSREFYVRLRQYTSSIGNMMVKTDFLDEPVQMELIGNDIWRGMVPLNTLEDGTFCCTFLTTNTYAVTTNEEGVLMHRLDTTPRYWAEAAQTTNAVSSAPTGGNCQELEEEHDMKFRVPDSAYARIILNLNTMEYTVCRAEYQNFNEWNAYTNFFAMTYGQPDKKAYKENFDTWNLNQDSVRIENFIGYPTFTNTYQSSFETFGQFWAMGATYVSELTQASATNSPYHGAQPTIERNLANVAVRLIGGDMLSSVLNTTGITSFGYLSTLGDTLMDGLKTYSFKARVDTPITSAQLVQYIGENMPKITGTIPQNYSFFANTTVLQQSPEEFSVSVVGYIQNDGTFYEVRLTQCKTTSGTLGSTPSVARLEIYRWIDGTPSRLAVLSSLISVNLNANTSRTLTIRLHTSAIGTTIIGFCDTVSLTYTDSTANRLQYGNAGFLVGNCRAQFRNAQVASFNGSAVGTYTALPFDATTAAYNWSYPAGRYIIDGALTSVIPSQNLALYIQDSDYDDRADPTDSGWRLATNITVSSYQYASFSYTPKAWQARHVKLQNTGNSDIAIDEIEMRSWHGQETGGNLSEWTAEEAWVTAPSEDSARGTVVELDMTRADERKSNNDEEGARQYIMTPLMERGKGQLAFDYKVVTPPVQLTVQQRGESGNWTDIAGFSFTNKTATGWIHTSAYVGNTNSGFMRVVNDGRYGITNGVVRIDNIVAWDEPFVSNTSWKVYNGMVTDADKQRVTLDETKVLFLNNSTTDGVEADMSPMDSFHPYLKSPVLANGLGELRFEARLYNTNASSGTVLVYALTNDDWYAEDNWLLLDELTVTNIAKQYYTAYTRDTASYDELSGGNFRAIKLQTFKDGSLPRVCIENVSVSEPVYPGFDINDVRTLYHKNNDEYGYRDQPLVTDLIGIEARLTNLRMAPSNINVYVSYYVGTNKWGIQNLWGVPNRDNWKYNQATTIKMVQSEDDPQVYRTPFNDDIPFQEENTVVQYCVWATYWDSQGATKYFQRQKEDAFTTPSWYYPMDLNAQFGSWSPYFIVYKVPRGCVFVNEINSYESKGSEVASDTANNPYVELAIPANLSLDGWKMDFVDGTWTTLTKRMSMDSAGKTEVTNGYAFYLIGAMSPQYTPVLTNVDMYVVGMLDYFGAYSGGLRIRRPLGMYEHAVTYDYDGYEGPILAQYDPEGQLVYVGQDLPFGSLSVTNGTGATINDWSLLSVVTNSSVTNQCVFPAGTRVWTPGAPNLCQILPPIPEIYAGLSNVIVTAIIDPSDYALQNGTHSKLSFKIPKGIGWTNIVYNTRNWYRVTELTANSTNNLLTSSYFKQNSNTNYTLLITNIQEQTEIVASIERDPSLINMGLPRTVLNWLLSFPDSAIRYDSWDKPDNRALSLTELYWLNCDPTNYYVLDGGFTGKVERALGGSNVFLSVWMTLNKNNSGPQNLTVLRGNTEEDRAFKIKVKDDLLSPSDWVTARQYTFDENSFDSNHTCRLLIDTYPFYNGDLIQDKKTLFFKWMLEFDQQYISLNLLTNCPAGD